MNAKSVESILRRSPRAAAILVACFLIATGGGCSKTLAELPGATPIDYGMPERLGATWRRCRARLGALLIFAALTRREELYKDFIEEASRLYADSLVHDTPDDSQLIRLYVMISGMRILASTRIVENADKVARMIVNNYLMPNKTFPELRDMVNSGAMDPLRDFSEACREEIQRLQ